MSHITDEQSMIDYGMQLAQTLHGGDILLLTGDLGAGKTTLTKGIARGLGITEDIVSPTFSIMNMYEVDESRKSPPKSGKIKSLIHIDTYRLEHEEDLIEIGVEDYIGRPGVVTIIEWPEKIDNLLKDKKVIDVKIEHVEGGRKIDILGLA